MSVFLITSSFATTLLIPQTAFQPGGPANGRALAYLAHEYLGSGFGTVYDISTVLILWFAGASAMAGLLNLVPRYLPRYGMAPDWTRAVRPLVLVFIVIAFLITLIFDASVDAQGGAYATGVLVLITSAAVAVTHLRLAARAPVRRLRRSARSPLVLVYTTVANVVERPDGVKIAAVFIAGIVVTSVAVARCTGPPSCGPPSIDLDRAAARLVGAAAAPATINLIANEPDDRRRAGVPRQGRRAARGQPPAGWTSRSCSSR